MYNFKSRAKTEYEESSLRAKEKAMTILSGLKFLRALALNNDQGYYEVQEDVLEFMINNLEDHLHEFEVILNYMNKDNLAQALDALREEDYE